jgi:hypothetical protein
MSIVDIYRWVEPVVHRVRRHRRCLPTMVRNDDEADTSIDISKCLHLESDTESISSTCSFNRFSFDVRSVLDDDRRRLLKKYRETKKKIKVLFRRQADQGSIL